MSSCEFLYDLTNFLSGVLAWVDMGWYRLERVDMSSCEFLYDLTNILSGVLAWVVWDCPGLIRVICGALESLTVW